MQRAVYERPLRRPSPEGPRPTHDAQQNPPQIGDARAVRTRSWASWPVLILILGTIPALALWAYPGWLLLAEGYLPYFNLHRWLASPTLLWVPPYTVQPNISLQVPLPYMVASVYFLLGGSPLGGLRFAAALALLLGTVGVFFWLRQRWGEWPAVAAALVWLYSPATTVLSFRLGHPGELWLWAIVAWGLGILARLRSRGAKPTGVTVRLASPLVWFVLTWGVLTWPGPDAWLTFPWRKYTLLWGAAALFGAPFVAWAVSALRRLASSWLLALMLTALAARLTLVNAGPAYTQHVPPPTPVAIFGDMAIVLLDARVDQPPAAGRTVYVTTTWQILYPQSVDWTTFAQVLGPDNRIWGQHDKPTGGEYPTSHWQVGEVVSDIYVITVDKEAPPNLRLIMGLYNHSTLQRLRTRSGADYVEIVAR